MASYRGRLLEFQELLGADLIDLDKLRKLTFRVGCPDELGIRSKVWKVINELGIRSKVWKIFCCHQCFSMGLNRAVLQTLFPQMQLTALAVISTDQQLRMEHSSPETEYFKRNESQCFQKGSEERLRRAAYSQFVDEVILQPGTAEHQNNRTDVTMEDHPLNPHPESKWSQYFQDNEMLVQIDKDCRRLCPGLAFFQNPSLHSLDVLTNSKNRFETLRQRVEHSMLKAQTISTNWVGINIAVNKPTKRPKDDLLNLQEGQEAHWEVVERILFVYAKLNPGQGYVQGMNEIIGPIYYSFSLDADEMNYGQAEADTFWCFTNLMSEIRDNFIKHLDDSACGIGERMDKFMRMLKDKDTTLWLKLQEQDLKPQYYAFRWITLLLSQEFDLPDVLRLWDSLLADCQRFEFLISVCCAMLILVREDLLKSDFSTNMKLVQNYPSMDIHVILAKAVELAGMR